MSDRATRWYLALALAVVLAAGALLLVVTRTGRSDPGPVTSPAESTGTVPLPAIEWQTDDPRQDDDPWTAAFFEFRARDAAAYNARDFSDERLRAVASDTLLTERAGDALSDDDYYSGPLPAQILSIEVSPTTTSATVTVCQMQPVAWSPSYRSDRLDHITDVGIVYSYAAEQISDGHVQFTDSRYSSIEGRTQCDLDDATVGYFEGGYGSSTRSVEAIGPDGQVITLAEVTKDRWGY